jgi:hypothetical protein
MKLPYTGLIFLLVTLLGLKGSALSAPESSSERAKWLADLAAKSYEKKDFLRTETLCTIAIELDPYCIPARKVLEKLAPPISQGSAASREMFAVSQALEELRRAKAELDEARSVSSAQQKDPFVRKDSERAHQYWTHFSQAESQSRATQSTNGASFRHRESYLRALTTMTLERAKQLREEARAK